MKKNILLAALTLVLSFPALAYAKAVVLLNVSYDPTRELYEDYNQLFTKYWKDKTGDDLRVNQSHGGSGKQARSVIDGLKADVITLALGADIDAIAERSELIPADWQDKLPDNSTPYTSTIVFLVRKGNPKGIRDWDDLVKDGVQVITPNPKTSGGARWNYLAAYGFALKKSGNNEVQAQDFLKALFKNVPLLDTGARGSTTTFVQRGLGDVLLAWENEAYLALAENGKGDFEIVAPSISVLAEPPVAVVDKNADKKGNLDLAREYLTYLYTPEAQELIAKHYYRPRDPQVAEKYAAQFPKITLMSIADFGGWKKVQAEHFDDGGVFDKIYKP